MSKGKRYPPSTDSFTKYPLLPRLGQLKPGTPSGCSTWLAKTQALKPSPLLPRYIGKELDHKLRPTQECGMLTFQPTMLQHSPLSDFLGCDYRDIVQVLVPQIHLVLFLWHDFSSGLFSMSCSSFLIDLQPLILFGSFSIFCMKAKKKKFEIKFFYSPA